MDRRYSLFNSRSELNRSQTSQPLTVVNARSSWKIALEKIIDSNFVTAFMTVITIYALFGDDVRILAFSLESDDVFYGISTFCLF